MLWHASCDRADLLPQQVRDRAYPGCRFNAH